MSTSSGITSATPAGDFVIEITQGGEIKSSSPFKAKRTISLLRRSSSQTFVNETALEKLAEKTSEHTANQLASLWVEAVKKRGAHEVYAKIKAIAPRQIQHLLEIEKVRDILIDRFASELKSASSLPGVMKMLEDAPEQFRNSALQAMVDKVPDLLRKEQLALLADHYSSPETFVNALADQSDRWEVAKNPELLSKFPGLLQLLAQKEIKEFVSPERPLTVQCALKIVFFRKMPDNLRKQLLETMCQPEFRQTSSPWEIEALADIVEYSSPVIRDLVNHASTKTPQELALSIHQLMRLCDELRSDKLHIKKEKREELLKKYSAEIVKLREEFISDFEKALHGVNYVKEKKVGEDHLVMMYEYGDSGTKERLAKALAKGSTEEEFSTFIHETDLPVEGLLGAALKETARLR